MHSQPFLLRTVVAFACAGAAFLYGQAVAAQPGDPEQALGVAFTKIANNGSVLPAGAALGSGATDWACTRDNQTGLIFEVKVDSPGNLRHRTNTYTWFNSNAAANGGDSGSSNGGTCAGSTCDTQSYVIAVNASNLCGGNGWRLPTPADLQRIIDATAAGSGTAAVDAAVFPNLEPLKYWTRPNVAAIPTHAWAVGLDDGNALPRKKSTALRVILVRQGALP